jgi:predicted metal-binding membrane protein
MGMKHGLYCVGCCLGLMVALVTLGMMRPVWMVTVALVVLLERIVPRGERLAPAIGGLLIVAGVMVAVGWWPPEAPMEGM